MMDKWNKIPLRKKHEMHICDKWGDVLYKLRFNQCSAGETIEFLDSTEIGKTKRLLEFIVDNGEYIYPKDLYPRYYWRYTKGWKDKVELKTKASVEELVNKIIADNIDGISQQIIEKAHTWRKTIYDGIHKALAKGEEKRRGIFGANLMNVCKEFNINGVNQLLEEYTMEQVGWMIDMMTFTSYEMTKEGKNANNRLFGSGGLTDQQKRIIEFYKNID